MSFPLSPDRWRTLEPIIDAAVELAPERRRAFVDEASGGDAALKADLERLLAAYDRQDTLLDHAAAERFASLMHDGMAGLPAVLDGRYQIERELGRGGTATVYLARDLRHERNVAVKVLHPDLAAALGAVRFLAEIKTTAQLQHPHILPLHDSGEADGFLFYVMPYVEDGSLRELLARERQLPIAEAVRIAAEVASALDAAHGHGVIHRDIKPENILLHNGTALVADFGIALAVSKAAPRLTRSGTAVGTPQYMSPEQASGEVVIDARSDVYALGTVVFEMLAGEPPFSGATSMAILAKRAVMSAPRVVVLRATVPPMMDAAVARALARESVDRHQTAGDFADALQSSLVQSEAGAMARALGVLESGLTPRTDVAPDLSRVSGGRRLAPVPLAAVAAIAAIVLVAAQVGRRSDVPPLLDPNKIVVVPFRLTGADSSQRYLAEGVVDLLAPMLTGEGGPVAVDSRTAISTWNRVTGGREGNADVARDVARQVGAAKTLFGTLVFAKRRVTLSASIVGAERGDVHALPPVTGSVDSLQSLLDGLLAQLLLRNAVVPVQSVGALTSQSLPALRAYLDGRAAYRQAQSAEAIRDFTRALEIDSTFGLAALDLASATTKLIRQQRVCWNNSCRSAGVVPGLRDGGPTSDDTHFDRAVDLAWQSRAKLGSRDLPLLEALRGTHWPAVSSAREMLVNLDQAAAAAPDRAETQYFFGLVLLYQGQAVGYSNPLQQAEARFLRALALDPSYLPPLAKLVDVAAYERDASKLRHFGMLYLARDSATPTADYVRWRIAVGTGDEVAVKQIRARFDSLDVTTLTQIATASQMSGVALDDADRATMLIMNHSTEPNDGNLYWGHMLALNRGRPRQADSLLRFRRERDSVQVLARAFATFDALFGEGDGAAAEAEALARAKRLARDTLTEPARRPSSGTASPLQQVNYQGALRDAAQEALWEWAHGRLTPSTDAMRWLQQHDSARAVVSEMLIATDTKRSDAAALRARVDSAARSGCCIGSHHIDMLLAMAYERAGSDTAALRAVRRGKWRVPTMYLATYLRMEGRLAARVGDRDGAITAYEHYLALRSDPEPPLVAERDSIQAELTRLRSREEKDQTLVGRLGRWLRQVRQ